MLHPVVLAVLVSITVLLLVVSVVGVPVVLTRLPTDFFSRPERRLAPSGQRRPLGSMLLRGLKNVLGWVLLVLGLLMLVAPGPGVPTLFISLYLVDFPGKHRLQGWLISRPAVHRPVNALRRRAGRPPLELPAPAAEAP